MATYKLKRKLYGALGSIGKFIMKHPVGAATGAVAAGGAIYGGAKVAGTTKEAFTGNMGEENGAGY